MLLRKIWTVNCSPFRQCLVVSVVLHATIDIVKGERDWKRGRGGRTGALRVTSLWFSGMHIIMYIARVRTYRLPRVDMDILLDPL